MQIMNNQKSLHIPTVYPMPDPEAVEKICHPDHAYAYQAERAIIMAAGKGERMDPISRVIPKPMIPVHGTPMIESVIQALHQNDIHEIHIVTGYLKEAFESLPEKYPGVVLHENPWYSTCNNISSLYTVRDCLENAIILDGDQIIKDPSILHKGFDKSGYACIWSSGPTSEWVLDVPDLKENLVTGCHRNGADHGWQLYSISRWNSHDGKKLKEALEDVFIREGKTGLYWDDVALFERLGLIEMGIDIMPGDAVREIDNVSELLEEDSAWVKEIEKFKQSEKGECKASALH